MNSREIWFFAHFAHLRHKCRNLQQPRHFFQDVREQVVYSSQNYTTDQSFRNSSKFAASKPILTISHHTNLWIL